MTTPERSNLRAYLLGCRPEPGGRTDQRPDEAKPTRPLQDVLRSVVMELEEVVASGPLDDARRCYALLQDLRPHLTPPPIDVCPLCSTVNSAGLADGVCEDCADWAGVAA